MTEREFEFKYRDSQKQIKLLEARVNDLNNQLIASKSEQDKLHVNVNKYKERVDTLLLNSKKMEKDYNSLLEKYNELKNQEIQNALNPPQLPIPIPIPTPLPPPSQLISPGTEQNSSNVDQIKISNYQDIIHQLESELNDYKLKEKEIAEREKELSRKHAKTAYYQEELQKAQTQITMLESKIHIRTQEKNAWEQEVLELRDRLASISTSPPTSTPTIAENGKNPKRRVSHRSAVMATKGNEVVESFESVVEDLYARLGEAEDENREILNSLDNAQDEIMKKYQQILELQSTQTSLQNELRQNQDQNEILLNQYTDETKKNNELISEIKNIQTQYQEKEEIIKQLTNTNMELTKENQLILSQIKFYKSQLNGEEEEEEGEEYKSENKDRENEEESNLKNHLEYYSQNINDSNTVSIMNTSNIKLLKEELTRQLSRYESLRKHNAKLLYKLLCSRGNIQVCCRVRPRNQQEFTQGSKVCIEVIDEGEIACFDRRTLSWKSFHFDKVWDEYSNQSDIFSDLEPLALSVVDGYNACIFAYGQTGSGKTFTMNGYQNNFGISYRTFEKIFHLLIFKKNQHLKQPLIENEIQPILQQLNEVNLQDSIENISKTSILKNEENLNFEYFVEVSMLEIYNETIKDLLIISTNNSNINISLEIRNDADGNLSIPGLIKEKIFTLEDAMNVFERGSMNRATAATNMNETSSRSHSILIIYVTTIINNGIPVTGKLYLVDLAGSERLDKSGVTGQTLKETQYINKSLSALGDVMEGLQKKLKHIPYRNSKLTYLLQDSLGGNSKTMMIVTICPTELTADETLFALQFATRNRSIQSGSTKRNISWKSLEEALKLMKNELQDEKRKVQHLTNTLTETRREMKKYQDKVNNQADVKIRHIDESRKGIEFQIEVLTRTNGELLARLQIEKEVLRQSAIDIESHQSTIKQLQDQIKLLTREKEKIFHVLENKEKENETLHQLLKDKDLSSLSDRSILTSIRNNSMKSPKLPLNHSKSFTSPIISHPKFSKSGRMSTGSILLYNDLTKNDTPKANIEALCRPTFSSTQHIISTNESFSVDEDDETNQPSTPIVIQPPVGNYRQGTVNAMATPRSRDALVKHQERMKKKRDQSNILKSDDWNK